MTEASNRRLDAMTDIPYNQALYINLHENVNGLVFFRQIPNFLGSNDLTNFYQIKKVSHGQNEYWQLTRKDNQGNLTFDSYYFQDRYLPSPLLRYSRAKSVDQYVTFFN